MCVCRYSVLINGKTAIHDALVNKSVDFADRPEFFTDKLVNPDLKGCVVSPYRLFRFISAA